MAPGRESDGRASGRSNDAETGGATSAADESPKVADPSAADANVSSSAEHTAERGEDAAEPSEDSVAADADRADSPEPTPDARTATAIVAGEARTPDDASPATEGDGDDPAADSDETGGDSASAADDDADEDTADPSGSDATGDDDETSPESNGAAADVDQPAEPAAAGPSRLGVAARILVLAALLGASAVSALQLALGAEWLDDLLRDNDIEMPLRMRLLYTTIAGSGVMMLGAAALMVVAARRKLEFGRIEQVFWFASPLVLLPAFPMLTDFRAWRGRHNSLLPLVLITALALEVLLWRALRSVPDKVLGWYERARALAPAVWRRHGPLAVVLSGALFYAVFMSFFALRWHFKLQTHVFDLAINNNLLYGGLRGVFMHSPIVFPDEPVKYLAAHAKLGIYGFLPIYALVPRAETLIVLQSTLLGFGAVPLFGFARRHISPWLAACVSLAYLCFYPMHGANFYEVKLIPVASFFVLTLIWAADARRWGIFTVAFIWALLMREDMPIGLAVIGVFLLLTGHRPRVGLATAIVAAAWFFFIRFFVMEQAGSWWFPNMYDGLWAPGEKGYSSVVKTLITNPLFVLDKMIEKEKVIYVLHLLVPIVFLPARRWFLWAAFIPGVILTLLVTSYKPPTMFSFQYVMYWTPYIFVASALALRCLERSELGPARARAAAAAVLFASGVLTYNYGAFPARSGSLKGGYASIDFDFSDKERDRYANLRELMELIPPNAVLAATERVGAHVSSRDVMYSMREGPKGAEYILARKSELDIGRSRTTLAAAVKRGEYGVLRRLGDMALLKKAHDTRGNSDLARDWKL